VAIISGPQATDTVNPAQLKRSLIGRRKVHMASPAKHFIAGAIKHPGALTRKAKAAGMSINAYAEAHKHDPGQTGRQARFYLGVLKKGGK
jgi:hypothetical protein